MIMLGAEPLTIEEVVAVARDGATVSAPSGDRSGAAPRVTLDPAARARMLKSRSVVEAALREGRAIYGVTTGFGDLKDRHIPTDLVRTLQLNLVRSHAAGVGPPAPRDVVRAMLLLRAASLSLGASGCRPDLVEALIVLLERDVTPVIPIEGSVGASGDLAPLAHLALVLVGEGEAWLGGKRMPAALALRGAGLHPITLEAKEGLALVNGTQLSTALAALACFDARRVWEASVAAAALSTEVLLGSFRPARPEVQALRPYGGAIEAARRLMAFSEGSALVESHADCGRIQDPYSMRCVPQVMGAAWDAIEYVERQLEVEFNSVNDNPLVFADEGEVVSAGLFHAEPVGMAADLLKIAVAEIASIGERRLALLLDGNSGLPRALAASPGVESGYMMAQYTAAALVSENKVLAHPATVDSIPTGAGVEDHVSMAPIAGRHARIVVENAARVVALELMCGCRALEFRRPLTAGEGTERIYGAVRRLVPKPEGDRPLTDACETLTRWVLAGPPERLAQEVLSS
jgi:histidine ammonia-lyase